MRVHGTARSQAVRGLKEGGAKDAGPGGGRTSKMRKGEGDNRKHTLNVGGEKKPSSLAPLTDHDGESASGQHCRAKEKTCKLGEVRR